MRHAVEDSTASRSRTARSRSILAWATWALITAARAFASMACSSARSALVNASVAVALACSARTSASFVLSLARDTSCLAVCTQSLRSLIICAASAACSCEILWTCSN
jgi:hypothetical protein